MANDKGVLAGENKESVFDANEGKRVYSNADAFSQTPKYITDSSSTDRMARFFIADSYVDALKKFYSFTDSNVIIDALKNKGFFDFFITNISDSSQDRYQLTETMGSNYVLYGFNAAPEILTCTGVLKNTVEDDWRVQFLEFFKKIGGVSSLAKFYQYAYAGQTKFNVANFITFKYDSVFKRGALLNFSHSLTASNEMDIPFSFSFVVTKTIGFSQIAGSKIDLNQGIEAKIIDNDIATIRTISKTGAVALGPPSSGSSSNVALSNTAASDAKDANTLLAQK